MDRSRPQAGVVLPPLLRRHARAPSSSATVTEPSPATPSATGDRCSSSSFLCAASRSSHLGRPRPWKFWGRGSSRISRYIRTRDILTPARPSTKRCSSQVRPIPCHLVPPTKRYLRETNRPNIVLEIVVIRTRKRRVWVSFSCFSRSILILADCYRNS